MLLSKVHICNMALLSIGTRAIASLAENTPEAVYCNQHYELALEEVLRDHPWNFAQGRKSLARTDLPASWAREYSFAYAYPANCMHLHTLIDERGKKSQAFTVAKENDVPLILTDIEHPIAAYTTLETDTSRYDPLFARALAAKLAFHLAPVILKSGPTVAQAAEKAYQFALSRAKTADAREGKPYNEPEHPWDGGHDNPWIAARMGCYRA